MPTIQAIPTRYAGCHFRSRLEARWAVFFDTLGIRWVYEPEGFVGAYGEQYLPDFHLPGLQMHTDPKLKAMAPGDAGPYVEVKPTNAALRRDAQRIGSMVDYLATPIARAGLLILGDVPDPRRGVPVHSLISWNEGVIGWTATFLPVTSGLLALDLLPFGADCDIPPGCSVEPHRFIEVHETNPIRKAIAAARSARFEHGENGAT